MINLFNHNFDTEINQSVDQNIVAEARAIADLKEQLEVARREGFDAGRSIGQKEAQTEFDQEASNRFERDRQSICEQLAQLIAQDTQQQATTERDIVELFLGIAERLVPELISTYGPGLAVDRIRHAVQQARTDPTLTIRACSDLISALEIEAPGWLTIASRTAQIDLIREPQMPRGTAIVEWTGGRLEYDIEAACLTVLQSLAQAQKEYNEATEKAI